jgi:nicotinamidase/pyrazinamidase
MSVRDSALIIVDLQNDFCPGGALEIPEGDRIIPLINTISKRFKHVVATQDWHPQEHQSFASNHPGKKIYETVEMAGVVQVLWPDHCVQGSKGAEFHSDLNLNPVTIIVRKGTYPDIDSYSAFLDNDMRTSTGLEGYLKGLGISRLFIAGLATDFCVYFSAMDAVSMGFQVNVILDACRGIDRPPDNIKKSLQEMKRKEIKILLSSDI